VATGLALVDTIRGADFQTRSLLLALRAGEPRRVAFALALEAAHSSAGGGGTRARTARLVAALQPLVARSDSPFLAAVHSQALGAIAFLEGRFAEARRLCSEGEAKFREQCVGAIWEADAAQAFYLWSLSYLGDWKLLCSRVPHCIREAEERGDVYAATNLRIGPLNFVHLVEDHPDAARAAAETAMRMWSHHGFHHQHWDDLLANTTIDLYLGDRAGAFQRVERTWQPLKNSLLLHIQLVRIEAVQLRARATLALAEEVHGKERQRLLARAEADARRLSAERMAWSDPLAALVRAGVAHLRGEPERAAVELSAAVSGFDAADMGLHAEVARLAHGRLVGAAEGRAQVAAALAWLHNERIAAPDRVLGTLAPGC
jgi:hypothetical protein